MIAEAHNEISITCFEAAFREALHNVIQIAAAYSLVRSRFFGPIAGNFALYIRSEECMRSLSPKVLISGAGIAGPTLAYWLAHYGMKPTIVEKAPKLRTGGYIIDFWGLGFDIADRMGLLPELRRKG
jgi:NADPH-dependent 2,4-dienoyl-CoA reductase/sulfur reductase-like enzyme